MNRSARHVIKTVATITHAEAGGDLAYIMRHFLEPYDESQLTVSTTIANKPIDNNNTFTDNHEQDTQSALSYIFSKK